MKNSIHLLFITYFLLLVCQPVFAQKDIRNKDLKAIKMARQEAKKRKKEGWDVPPGSVPMEKLFEKAWAIELETDDDGNPKYIMSTGASVAGTNSAADLAAMTAARNELAAAIQTKVTQLVEAKTANDQIDQKIANTLDKTIANGKSLIYATLSQVKTAYKIYRQVEDKQNKRNNVEVQVKLFYNQDEALKAAQKAIRKKLEEESNELGEELDKILDKMGWPEQ